MSDEILQVNFRMPALLKNRLEEAAKITGRSLTSEIVTRLEESLDGRDSQKTPAAMNMIFDDDWFDETGLTADEFAHYVRLSILRGLTDNKE